MRIMFTAMLLLAACVSTQASGPYSPVRVAFERDEVYSEGRSIYWGDVKVGNGKDCGTCHSRSELLNRPRLQRVKSDLAGKIRNCVSATERVNGTVDGKQMEALVHYLAKRFRL